MTRATVAIEGIWLVREGDYAVVKVEVGGTWWEIIREHCPHGEGGGFSHITEPAGVRAAIERQRIL